LIVWLHGYGEAGTNNMSQLRWLELMFPDQDAAESAKFFVLVTQCPPDHPTWFRNVGATTKNAIAEDDPLGVLRAIIDQTTNDFPIDKDRILLAGVSSGASGCFEVAMRYPTLFAGVAPLGPGAADENRVARLRDVPMWAFISPDDGEDSAIMVRGAIQKLRKAGGRGLLTVTRDVTHDCWTTAFRDYDLLAWFLAQEKGGNDVRPPGTVPWSVRLASGYRRAPERRQVAQFAIAVAAVCSIIIAIRREWTRRKKAGIRAMLE
jgi:predicted peptidase